MINISEFDKGRWKSDSASKIVRVTFPRLNISIDNSGIIGESLELTQVIEDNTELSFTGCHASQMKIEFVTLTEDVRNEQVVVTIQADGTNELPLFVGYVSDQVRNNYEDEGCTITALDAFSIWASLDATSWFNNYPFPSTLLDFRASLAVFMGVDVVGTSLIFDNLQLSKSIGAVSMTAMALVKSICQLNGVYGRINNEGKLEFVSLAATTAETISKSNYSNVNYDGYSVDRIDKVQIRESEDDIGGVYGNGTNAYIVEANWMAFGKSGAELTQMAETLYNKVSQYVYMPAEIELTGLPYLECGDRIETDTENSHITTYILSRTLKGLNGLSDSYKAEGDKVRSKYVADVHEEIKQLKGKSNTLSRTVEETKSQITDLESNVRSTITQLSDSVAIQIENIYDELDGSITTYNINEVPTLLNYPAWDFTYNIPCNNTVKTTNDLTFIYKNEYYSKNSRALVYNTTDDVSYRFKKSEGGVWYWEEVAESDFAVAMKKITALEIKDGEITSSIEQITTDITDLGETTETLSTRITQTTTDITAEVTRAQNAEESLSTSITQTADSITAEVNRAKSSEESLSSSITQTAETITSEVKRAQKAEEDLSSSITQTANKIESKVSIGEISSRITQEAGQITLSSNRLVVNSTNFSLSADGTIKAKNAEISGKITASSGTIAGMTVNTDGLFYDKWFAISPKAGGLRVGEFTTDMGGNITARSATIGNVAISNIGITAPNHNASFYSVTAGIGGISSSGKISTTGNITASGSITASGDMSCRTMTATTFIMGYTALKLQSLNWKYVASLGGCVLNAYSGPSTVMGA